MPITVVLILAVLALTFVSIALALYHVFSGAIENTRVLFYRQAERIIDGLIEEIGAELDRCTGM